LDVPLALQVLHKAEQSKDEAASLLTRPCLINPALAGEVAPYRQYFATIDSNNPIRNGRWPQSEMIPLNTLSVLEFSGRDAVQFLHSQLSADITGIPVGDAGFACCCNPAGRVLGLLLVSPRETSVLVICASELAGQLKAWLGRYIIRADVQINLRTDLAAAALPDGSAAKEDMVLQATKGLAYVITTAADESVSSDGADARTWKETELKAGVVWLGTQSSTQFLPQMLGYESIGALSFKKGCFPGQEIIARMRYLGTLKRRPMLLSIGNEAPAGIMEKVTLSVGDESHGGVVVDRVVVDQAGGTDEVQTLFLVVRAATDIQPESGTIGERHYAVLSSV